MLFTTPLLLALGIATNAFSASALVITARAGDGVRVKGPKDLSSWRNIMTEAQLKAVSGGGGPIAIQLDAPGATPNAPRDQAHVRFVVSLLNAHFARAEWTAAPGPS
jgi:hypothetical protein